MTKEERKSSFLEKANEVHGGKYNYSKVEYECAAKKVCIICPIHGEFYQTPNHHLKGHGCPICAREVSKKISNSDEFIEKAKSIYGDKYDYSKTVYIDRKTKICVTCKEHGDFYTYPFRHINIKQRGGNCPVCSDILRRKNTKKTQDEFIEKAKSIYGDKYDYSKTVYTGAMDKIIVTCKEHGDFETTPNRFLSGHSCPTCGGNKPLTTNEFIKRANKIHHGKYDYSKTIYNGRVRKLIITCKKHGDFYQLANSHLTGSGCPICKISKMEDEVRNKLLENEVKFESYKKFPWLGLMSLDFYIEECNLAIECQGIQHFSAVGGFVDEDKVKIQKQNDIIKRNLCKEHGIEILYYTIVDKKYTKDCEYKDDIIFNINELWEKVNCKFRTKPM